MEPHTFTDDLEWKELKRQLAIAEEELVKKTAQAERHCSMSPHLEQLRAAKEWVRALQSALADREATISRSGWGRLG